MKKKNNFAFRKAFRSGATNRIYMLNRVMHFFIYQLGFWRLLATTIKWFIICHYRVHRVLFFNQNSIFYYYDTSNTLNGTPCSMYYKKISCSSAVYFASTEDKKKLLKIKYERNRNKKNAIEMHTLYIDRYRHMAKM